MSTRLERKTLFAFTMKRVGKAHIFNFITKTSGLRSNRARVMGSDIVHLIMGIVYNDFLSQLMEIQEDKTYR